VLGARADAGKLGPVGQRAALEVEIGREAADAQHRLGVAGASVGRGEDLVQGVHAGRDAVGVGALEEQEAGHRVRVGRSGPSPQVGVEAADGLQQDQRGAVRGCHLVGGQRDAQHAQHHVRHLEQAARVEEALGLVAQHRAVRDSPDQRGALLDVLRDHVRLCMCAPTRGSVAAQRQRRRVDRLPHLGADHVADRARALASALDAGEHRAGQLRVGRQPPQRLGARRSVLGDAVEHREQAARAEADAGQRVRRALQLGLEDGLDGACGELRAREVAS
jgi:hypothetical protein